MNIDLSSTSIVEAVRRLLEIHQPCRAKYIAIMLGNDLGCDVPRKVVNQVLYGPLRTEARKDEEHQWSLTAQSRPVKADGAGVELPAEKTIRNHEYQVEAEKVTSLKSLERGMQLETVQRLRSGLPPVSNLEQITIGYRRLERSIRDLLNRSKGPRWMIANGEYGGGKSHYLRLCREVALRSNFAVSYLCADSGENALNHPQRYLCRIIDTMELPSRLHQGYPHLLYDAIQRNENRGKIYKIFSNLRMGRKLPFRKILDILGRIRYREWQEKVEDESVDYEVADDLVREMCGHSITHRAASYNERTICYNLLDATCKILKQSGYSGLVILIDEVESVFTKLPNAQSRKGAVRVLSALCCAPGFDDLKVVLASTPDSHRRMLDEIDSFSWYGNLPKYEEIDTFYREWDFMEMIHCRGIKPGDFNTLLEKIRKLYVTVYGNRVLGPDGKRRWQEYVATHESTNGSVRIAIRQTIDVLDGIRFQCQTSDPH